MKSRQPKVSHYTPRIIERVMFGVLGAVLFFSGLYLAGPWYLEDNLENKAPIFFLLNSTLGVTIFGALMMLDGLALFYASAGRGVHYAKITANALLAGFLLRLYSLIGVFLTIDSWRPPSYLSHIATVVLLGALWVWVRVNDRLAK